MPLLVKAINQAGMLISSPDSRQFHSGLVLLEEGNEVGEHETGSGEEMIIFMEGTAEVSCDGESKTVKAPAVAVIPPHTPHSIRNRSRALLRYVYVYNTAAKG